MHSLSSAEENAGTSAVAVQREGDRINGGEKYRITSLPKNSRLAAARCCRAWCAGTNTSNIIPRITKIAGFELGSGIYVNTSFPEDDAGFLRQVSVPEAVVASVLK